MPRGSTTNDGRHWACNQRRRWWPEALWQSEGSVRHLMDGDVPICTLPSRGASRLPENKRAAQRRYTASQRAKGIKPKTESNRKYRLRSDYGMTPNEFASMLEAQDGLCAICRERPAVQVDHDHGTDAVRELLCGTCNRMLGQAHDDPALLRAGARYLEKHRRPG